MPSSSSSTDTALPAKIGRYEVVRLIGEGAMGRVLLAHDPVLGRDVAVKLLRDDLRIPSDVREGLVVRMRHEAKAAARVAHPNLVTLHDMGEDDAHGLYLVFEFVEGPTLKQRLLEGPLAPHQAARLARELGVALTFAHRGGIVHRDVKPENVILSSTGGKIADFGIARIPDSTLTHAGGLLGTPAYSAPETFRAGQFSPESDQFSLAATLYEAIAGKRAYPGDDAVAVASRIANEEPAPFAADAGLDRGVDEVLGRALSKTPEARFPSCEAFGLALSKVLADRRSRGTLPQPTDGASATQTDFDPSARPGGLDAARDGELPRERKLGQVFLGGVVVVVTAALLVRTAVRSSDTGEDSTAAGPGSAAPEVSAAPSARVKPPPAPRARPRPSAEASADPDVAPPDAGTAPASTATPSATAPLPAAPADAGAVPASTSTPRADAGP